ncbi:proline-rich transmembrane protein 4 isoform X1 [Canis lupus familiaris]|uniref:Proline rich transmembrane protein 4 n=3 Tax=Canis lupus familiaris TaxID=9615 RepID=A0A8C0MNB2_CANLF|nr:proline-rich transmembrane protein 4 isoform X1 [Canis lupus familiaris]XP_005628478.2 proline-rich transmembrane protein 4 isoform X1 [Canis lupus familiaris]XP_038542150.1 proline-rich transmembrane protein 4 isoform X1 [Canis lupus familiaris]XP_038542151.1 proline-rich transmembrane protein 4 isoform X1 [Canis lupus familiaris]
MAGHSCLGLGLFCWVLLAVPVGPQPASSVTGVPLTTLTSPPQSEASMLSLNLGLNFKFHLRGPAAAWALPVTETQPLSSGPSREPEEEVASGLRTDPFWELLVGSLGNSPPEWGSAEGSSTPWTSSLSPESTSPISGPTDRPTAPYQPRMGTVTWNTALTATAPPSSAPRLRQSELELKFDMALRAGAAPTLGHRTLPLLPSLRASLAEIAGRLGPFGFFGTTLSPLRNLSGPSPLGPTPSPSSASQVSDSPGFFGTTLSPPPFPLERKLPSSGPLDPAASLNSATMATASVDPTISTSGLDEASPASLGKPSVEPECGPGSCSIAGLPGTEGQPPGAPLPLFFLTLEADWAEARARWGLAWEAHVYGVGTLFGLVALLALLALALLPWRCPPGAPCLALLDLLLLSAGTTRAFPLFYDAYGHRDRLPPLAWLLLQDLPLPCLAAGLGLACLLLARPRPPRCPAGLAALLLLGLGLAAAAAVGSAAHRPLRPLRLASRGLHALLAALLSGLLLALSCWGGRRRRAGAPLGGSGFKGATPVPQARSPFAPRESWRRAARTAPVAGTFGLLSGALQGYEVLHALGYGGQPGLEGPWPWWTFQLGLRLGEVGVALPLALLGLYPALSSPRVPPRCWAKLFRLSPGHAAPLLPGGWVTGPPDKEPLGGAIARGDAELLQLCALAGPGPDLLLQGGGCRGFEGAAGNPAPSPASSPCSDYTVDFRPPSPINLRRSIEEALCSEALLTPGLFQGPAFGEALPGLGLYRTTSLGAKTRAGPSGRSEEAPGSSAPQELPSPGAWPAGSSASSGSLCGLSRDSSSMLLCSSPDRPPRCPLVCVLSPPRPSGCSPSLPGSGSYQALSPPSRDSPEPTPELQAAEALLQEQFLDACRQIDELSVGSDTIDL